MIGAANLRWLQRRAQHHGDVAFQHQLDEALAERRAGRAERSCRSAKGWSTRIHGTYGRDPLIRYITATTTIAVASAQQIKNLPKLYRLWSASSSFLSSGHDDTAPDSLTCNIIKNQSNALDCGTNLAADTLCQEYFK